MSEIAVPGISGQAASLGRAPSIPRIVAGLRAVKKPQRRSVSSNCNNSMKQQPAS
jgi:hypothetical protein